MNKKELIERIKNLPFIYIHNEPYLNKEVVLEFAKHLDEPETGHADEAPRDVKNILARLRELPLHDREVWLKAIMGEFEQDFSRAKWREGYEQGKVEGMIERKKVTIPQFVAEYIEESRLRGWDLLASMCFVLTAKNKKTTKWFYLGENKNIFALAWIFGYTVEADEEKKYKITLLNRNDGDLYLINQNAGVSDKYGHFSPVVLLFTKGTNFSEQCYKLTKKEVVSHGFGWVFDCPGVQIEEVIE